MSHETRKRTKPKSSKYRSPYGWYEVDLRDPQLYVQRQRWVDGMRPGNVADTRAWDAKNVREVVVTLHLEKNHWASDEKEEYLLPVSREADIFYDNLDAVIKKIDGSWQVLPKKADGWGESARQAVLELTRALGLPMSHLNLSEPLAQEFVKNTESIMWVDPQDIHGNRWEYISARDEDAPIIGGFELYMPLERLDLLAPYGITPMNVKSLGGMRAGLNIRLNAATLAELIKKREEIVDIAMG